MSFIDRWRHRLRARFSPEAVRQERDAEVAFHLSLAAMHAERGGLSPDDAQVTARRQFGNVTTTKEDARAVSRSGFLDTLSQDVRYAFRTLRQAPAYAIGAGLTLAIGIGATTAVFSVADAVWLRALPYPDSGKLYVAAEQNSAGGLRTPSYLAFQDYRADSAAWVHEIDRIAFVRGLPTWLDGPAGFEVALVGCVSPGFFDVLGVKPVLGRMFSVQEQAHGGDRVAILSFDAWKRYFGGDTAVIGKTVDVDSVPTVVIGVMPRGVTFPQWSSGRNSATSMWIPVAHIEATDPALMKRSDHADSRVVVRVRATSDSTRAAIALSVTAARLAAAYPNEARNWTRAAMFNVRDGTVGPVRALVKTLAGAVGLVLLLACANASNLALARGGARAREVAVRASLGATRQRVVRQLLTEGLVLGVFACAGGIVLASLILAATQTIAGSQLAGSESLRINVMVLSFAVALSVFTALAASLFPALRATRTAPASTLRSATHAATGTRADHNIRNGLVVVQLALAVVLLIGTGLLVRSIRNIGQQPLGYDPDGLVVTAVTPPAKYATASDALTLYQTILERLRSIPGVSDAAYINHAPGGFGGGMPTNVVVDGRDPLSNDSTIATPMYRTVSETYLRTMEMEMARGQWFTSEDMLAKNRFVLNEALARRLFPGVDPVGKTIVALRAARTRPDHGQPVRGTVVGVLRDIRSQAPDQPPLEEIFVPFTLETWHWGALMVRTTDVGATISGVREAITTIEPGIPEARASGDYNGPAEMRSRLDRGLGQHRMALSAVGAFAGAALLLAVVGLYAVVSYGVSRRRRELGVRLALGATRGEIVRLVVGEGARVAVLGVVLGCLVSVGATRVLRSLLFQTPLIDVPTYGATAATLVLCALVACYLPARRASRLPPTEAISGQ